eukprot:m.364070 g.364070  ORF g.364070 m.364070 type:complete len:51 (-) comp28075_c1_seq3:251-403(-)
MAQTEIAPTPFADKRDCLPFLAPLLPAGLLPPRARGVQERLSEVGRVQEQ